MVKWMVELGKYGTEFEPRVAIKAQASTKFIQETTKELELKLWQVYVDVSVSQIGCGEGVVVICPTGEELQLQLYSNSGPSIMGPSMKPSQWPVENVTAASNKGNKIDRLSAGALKELQGKPVNRFLLKELQIKLRPSIYFMICSNLSERPRLPYEFTRLFNANISSKQCFSINMLVHVNG